MGELSIHLLPKQYDLLHAPERHRMYSGAVGAGKTRWLGTTALLHTMGRPRTRYGLFRKTNVSLVRSTLKTLLEGDGDAPPVLMPGSYHHHKMHQEITLHGGGTILYAGLDDPLKVRSMNLSSAGIDEVTECALDDYRTVNDRVRMGDDQHVNSATNPGPPSHWAAEYFGIKGREANSPDNRVVMMTRTSDNTFLPPGYLEELETYTGAYYRRMVLGDWCQAEGVVYDVFDREKHVHHIPESRHDRIYAGVDFGYVDPFVCLRIERHDGDQLHIRSEVYQTKLQPDQQVERAKATAPDASEIACDSAEPGTIQMMRNAGLPAIPCQKGPESVLRGIRRVSQRLANGTLTIEPDCTHTIAEFETYAWKENKLGLRDCPAEGSDHAMDALRYLIDRHDSASSPVVSVVGERDPDAEPEKPKTFAEMRQDQDWGFEQWN